MTEPGAEVEAKANLPTKKGFYSKLEEVVNTKMKTDMPVDQLKKTLLNNGVTVDEVNAVLGGMSGKFRNKM